MKVGVLLHDWMALYVALSHISHDVLRNRVMTPFLILCHLRCSAYLLYDEKLAVMSMQSCSCHISCFAICLSVASLCNVNVLASLCNVNSHCLYDLKVTLMQSLSLYILCFAISLSYDMFLLLIVMLTVIACMIWNWLWCWCNFTAFVFLYLTILSHLRCACFSLFCIIWSTVAVGCDVIAISQPFHSFLSLFFFSIHFLFFALSFCFLLITYKYKLYNLKSLILQPCHIWWQSTNTMNWQTRIAHDLKLIVMLVQSSNIRTSIFMLFFWPIVLVTVRTIFSEWSKDGKWSHCNFEVVVCLHVFIVWKLLHSVHFNKCGYHCQIYSNSHLEIV